MGIEPTWDFVEPHAGFEDQERHQAAAHLHAAPLHRLPLAGVVHFRRAASQKDYDRFERTFQSKLITATHWLLEMSCGGRAPGLR